MLDNDNDNEYDEKKPKRSTKTVPDDTNVKVQTIQI